jgi:hypothetical protein
VADFQAFGTAAADRVVAEQGEGFSMDSITVATVVTMVISGIAKCWQKDHEVPTVAAYDRLRRMNSKNPERTLNKLSRAVKFGAAKEGRQLTVDETEALAKGILAEALATDEETFYGLCKAAL